jgi:PKD repeat protein
MAISTPATVEFRGGQSSDPDGSIVEYSWEFSDGVTRGGQVVTREFGLDETGTIEATLTVRDNRGATDSDTATVDLVLPENEPPQAIVSPTQVSGTVPLEATFDASNSTAGDDPYPNELTYEWEVEGDVKDVSGPTATFEFVEPGGYSVILRVTDTQGASDERGLGVIAEKPPNEPPQAVATADPVSGQTPLDVQFDGGQSSDPDGDILDFNWDFSDGVTESGQTVTRTFTDDAPQSVVATLTTTDSAGNTDTDSVTVELTDSGLIDGVDDETVAQAAIVGASISSSIVFD